METSKIDSFSLYDLKESVNRDTDLQEEISLLWEFVKNNTEIFLTTGISLKDIEHAPDEKKEDLTTLYNHQMNVLCRVFDYFFNLKTPQRESDKNMILSADIVDEFLSHFESYGFLDLVDNIKTRIDVIRALIQKDIHQILEDSGDHYSSETGATSPEAGASVADSEA